MQKLVNRQAVLYEWSRFESQWSMSALLAPSGGGGNLLWTQNTPENDGATSDDKGNKELLQTAEREITDRLEMEKKK